MERTLLYYPTIDIPDTKWLYSSILYSDKVASIVPFKDTNEEKFPALLRYLIDENQYSPIFIEKLLSQSSKDFEEFEDFFIKTTSSKEFIAELKNKRSLSNDHFYTLYGEKLTDKIKRHLLDKELVRKETDDGYITDELVSLFYMSLLAQYVAKTIKGDLIIPSTGDKRYENIGFRNHNYKEPAISFIIENCLPVPAENTPMEKIIDFKRKRRDELIEFRKFLAKVQDEIKKATDEQEIKEIQIDTKESIEKGINDLTKLYNENSIITFFTSFESLLKMDSPKLFQTLTTAGLIATPINPAIAAVTGLIGVAGGIVSTYYKNQRDINKSELSYLFHAKQELKFE